MRIAHAPPVATAKQREMWGKALAAALAAHEMTQDHLANKVRPTVSQGQVSNWCNGKNVPEPEAVFQIEEVLDLEPGALSSYLGFVPVGVGQPRDVLGAISADQHINDQGRRMLLDLYASAVRSSRIGS